MIKKNKTDNCIAEKWMNEIMISILEQTAGQTRGSAKTMTCILLGIEKANVPEECKRMFADLWFNRES